MISLWLDNLCLLVIESKHSMAADVGIRRIRQSPKHTDPVGDRLSPISLLLFPCVRFGRCEKRKFSSNIRAMLFFFYEQYNPFAWDHVTFCSMNRRRCEKKTQAKKVKRLRIYWKRKWTPGRIRNVYNYLLGEFLRNIFITIFGCCFFFFFLFLRWGGRARTAAAQRFATKKKAKFKKVMYGRNAQTHTIAIAVRFVNHFRPMGHTIE